MLPETNTQREKGKYPMIKVLQGCLLKLILHLVNSVLIFYRTGNMQSATLSSFVASSSLPPCRIQYVVYNIYVLDGQLDGQGNVRAPQRFVTICLGPPKTTPSWFSYT